MIDVEVSCMQRMTIASLLLVLLSAAGLAGSALAQGDAETGGAIAERWCSSCHLVSPDQTTATADVPSFASIAERSDSEIDALEGFLADPHPPMPDMSLTRNEIRDLLAYIRSLRD
jgi:mono/diheme cytochrome c family protein